MYNKSDDFKVHGGKLLKEYETKIIRSKRKSVSLEVSDDLCVIVRTPLRYSEKEIEKLLCRHEKWILKAIERRSVKKEKYPELSQQEIRELCDKSERVIAEKVKYYSQLTGLYPTGVKITKAKKRFGSCSAKNSLCFSCYLLRYPEDAIDYVVLHEVAHIKHHNHSKDFYNLISRYMPDYKMREKLLKT